MTLPPETILLYLTALSLTVATLWSLSYATPTISLKEPRDLLVLIIVIIPFVMLLYFGGAFIISDMINERAEWLQAMRSELGDDWLKVMRSKLSFTESLIAAVTYVGLSGWLWLRWRDPKASTGILGPAIIAMAIILIVVAVISAVGHDHIF